MPRHDWLAKAWLLERIVPDEFGPKERRSDEVDKPRHGVVVDAEPDPVHAILDEAKGRVAADPTGPDWIMLALEKLTGKSLGANRQFASELGLLSRRGQEGSRDENAARASGPPSSVGLVARISSGCWMAPCPTRR